MIASHSPAPLSLATVTAGLHPRRIGRRVWCLEQVSSTNDVAFLVAARDGPAADGLAVFAEHQTSGRGRFERRWHAPRGCGVLASVALVDALDAVAPADCSLRAAVAACRAVREAAAVPCGLRWPNDLYIGRRKVGGILIESRRDPGAGRVTVIGVGINCLESPTDFPPELRDAATSLAACGASGDDLRERLARALLAQLDARFADPPASDMTRLAAEWRALSDDCGRRLTVRCGARHCTGVVIAIDPAGDLQLRDDAGRTATFSAATATVTARFD